jgi:PKD repeat protein
VLAEPPAASFTAPTVLQIGQNGTFTSTTPEPDADGNTIASVEWDFEDDGTYDASGTSVQHSYPTAGTRTVRMRVTDSAAEQAETTRSVRVNRVPTASFTANPSSALIGQTVNFNGSGSSDDTTITTYEWDLDGNGSFETNTGSNATTSLSYATPGTRQVKLQVTDADGSVSPVATRDVTVTNGNPTASFTATPNPAAADQVVTFNGSASSDPDPGGSIAKYEWDLDGNGSFERDTGTTAITTYAHPTPGSRTVKLRVTDNNDATDVDAKTVTVNSPPAASFTAAPNPQVTGQPVSLNGSASHDNDGTIVKYEWDLDGNGSFEIDGGATATRNVTYSTAGTRQVGLRVTDDDGGTGTTTWQVVVHNAPTANFTWLAPAGTPNRQVPEVGELVTFDASTSSANDAGGSITRYEWDMDANGSFETDTGASPVATNSYGTAGTKSIKLRVTDDQGAQAQVTKDLLVNAPPVARVNILNSASEPGQKHNTPLVGQSFVFTGQPLPALPGQAAVAGSSDPEDGDHTHLTYEWDLDDDGLYGADDNPDEQTGLNAGHPGFPTAGQRSAGVRVTDSKGATSTGRLNFRVNSPPQPAFTWEPLTPLVGQAIRFSSTSTDPDGNFVDPLTFAWDLDNDGTFGEAGNATNPNEQGQNPPAVAFGSAGNKTVKLRVTDTGGITRELTREVLVQLSVPNGGFTSSPGAPLPGQTVRFDSTSTPSDPLTKSITSIEWDFDYNPSTDTFAASDVDATGASVTRAFATAGPKTVAVKVTEGPFGGFDIEAKTIAVNAPPRASFGVAPASPVAGDVVTLSSTSADSDGPLAGQAWDLDGDGAFDDASGAVVSVSFAAAGTYTIALRVTDDKGASQVGSDQVLVRTRPLAAPRVLTGVAVQIAGRTRVSGALVTLLNVRAPKGSRVVVRCNGPSCPKRKMRRTVRNKDVRFKAFERFLDARVTITVVVSKQGFISRYTKFDIRGGKPPKRVDRCIQPGAKRPTACPA